MLIFTTRFSKKKAVLTVIVIGAVIAALVILAGHFQKGGNADLPQLTDNPQRVAYLQSLGWEIETEPLETLQFLLPATLTEPYLSYNQLRYTYAVTNYPGRSTGVQINLYVCEDLPVAGDVCCPGSDGFQDILAYPESDT